LPEWIEETFGNSWITSPWTTAVLSVAFVIAVPSSLFFLFGTDDLLGRNTFVQFAASSGSIHELIELPAILGSLLLWLCMLYFWSRLDETPNPRKAMWTVALTGGTVMGACLYYSFVYSTGLDRNGEQPMFKSMGYLRFFWGGLFVFVILLAALSKLGAQFALLPMLIRFALFACIILTVVTSVMKIIGLFKRRPRPSRDGSEAR
jgi:hypothetical protein